MFKTDEGILNKYYQNNFINKVTNNIKMYYFSTLYHQVIFWSNFLIQKISNND
jgi:hypothetical protein